MIRPVSVNTQQSYNRRPQQTEPNFRGLSDGLLAAVQAVEAEPMLNVTVLDMFTAILPRTWVESRTNAHAGFEAFRRESSGLVVNCLIPGYIVMGLAGMMQKSMMGQNTTFAKSWADEDTLNLVSKHWKDARGTTDKERVSNTIKSLLSDIKGVDGDVKKDGLKSFAPLVEGKNFDKSIEDLTNVVMNQVEKGKVKSTVKGAYQDIVSKTHISENIKVGDSKKYFGSSLQSIITETPTILKEMLNGGIKEASNVDKFISNAKKLVNAKSLAGLGIVVPLAASMQPINRWITAKSSGKKGAPIYKDFEDTAERKLTDDQKSGLLKQKIISVGAMTGVTLLSMMKMPSMKMLQFKNLFPSMDQARIIASASFSSRMLASEDENELRESTVRDIATFSSFYFLGDYAAKAAATIMEKINPKNKLLNITEALPDDAGILKKFTHWVQHTKLKSSDELDLRTPGGGLKKLRAWCQIANIGFSLVLLGVLIPLYTRGKTDKKHAEELRQKGASPTDIAKYYPPFENRTRQNTPVAFKAVTT